MYAKIGLAGISKAEKAAGELLEHIEAIKELRRRRSLIGLPARASGELQLMPQISALGHDLRQAQDLRRRSKHECMAV